MSTTVFSRIYRLPPEDTEKHQCSICPETEGQWVRVVHEDSGRQKPDIHYFHWNCLHAWIFPDDIVPKELITYEKSAEELATTSRVDNQIIKAKINITCPMCQRKVNVYDLITLKDRVVTWIRYIFWEKKWGLLLFLAGIGMVFISNKGKAYFPPYDTNMLALTKAGLVLGAGMITTGFTDIFGPQIVKRLGQATMLAGTAWATYIAAKEMFLF